ncbi:MAG: zinc ribbon domain-containing protein [Syntrophomonadaceae bacterium]|jgi:hypothetical protein|nr:zinc ribbon domain-containing protein [Bacillota bacterium]
MDRVLKKIEEGMSHVQGGIDKGKVKLQEAQAIAQQRKIIREASERKAKDLLELGQLVYKKVREGSIVDDDFDSVVQAVIQSDCLIFKALNNIEEIKRSNVEFTVCECGSKVASTSIFCGNCGAKIHREEEDDQEGVLCAVCEGKVPSTAAFCGCCGWKLEAQGRG